MSQTSFESRSSTPVDPEKPAQNTPKATKQSRTTRLQFERLEDREVPAVVAGGDLSDPSSAVLQAAQMSAYFQQTALIGTGQPTSSPTLSWNSYREEPVVQHPLPLLELRHLLSDDFAEKMDSADPLHPMLQIAPGFGIAIRGGTGKVTESRVTGSQWPAQVFAPYVDMGVRPTVDLVDASVTRGIKFFNLGFVTADPRSRPSWSGREAIDGGQFDLALRRQIEDLRAMGGDVAVSFGGPTGMELAQAITDVNELKLAYRHVVDAYALTRVDFDLEEKTLQDSASIERRSAALAELERELGAVGRKLDVWFTLPASPRGLTDESMAVVRSALRHGVELGGVNIRPTNYADQTVLDAKGKMGLYSVQAAINTFDQLHTALGPNQTDRDVWRKIGITPTVGRNGEAGETLSQQDAREVLAFARQHGAGMIGMWSLNRDQQSTEPSVSADEASGGVDQEAFEFSRIFQAFTKMLPR